MSSAREKSSDQYLLLLNLVIQRPRSGFIVSLNVEIPNDNNFKYRNKKKKNSLKFAFSPKSAKGRLLHTHS